MHKLLKTMLLWMLLALPLQAFASAGRHDAHALQQAAARPCEASDQAPDQAPDDDASHHGSHAAGGACVACEVCCPAAVPALLQSDAFPAFDALCGPIAYTPAYLPRVTPAPPEHPPRVPSV
ncbi:hypothetical protein [Herminiimonas sp. CN]|uniref:hypothetical protein n=1 Tax=Herminiimonas sp. CN TaxID=1349818 RepID=UPI000473A7D7|nr:hypothetical protein [Herminiimonas sp. CN]